jgi:hypothetical protein
MIPYTYEIINVDAAARVMEVVYTSPGRQTMHISARLPYVGETLEQIVDMYSPSAYWQQQDAEVVVPTVGTSGTSNSSANEPITLEAAKYRKLAEIANWRYRRETSGITLNGAKILTDRESQATVTGAFASLQAGLIQSVDWKAASGQWLSIGLQEMTAIAQAVAEHVQDSFTREKVLTQMVDAAQTVEDVEAIDIRSVYPNVNGSIPSTAI